MSSVTGYIHILLYFIIEQCISKPFSLEKHALLSALRNEDEKRREVHRQEP